MACFKFMFGTKVRFSKRKLVMGDVLWRKIIKREKLFNQNSKLKASVTKYLSEPKPAFNANSVI